MFLRSLSTKTCIHTYICILFLVHFFFQCHALQICEVKWSESRSVMSKSLQPRDCSLLGSSVHAILQARILEWVAVPFSGVSSEHRYRTQVSSTASGFFTIWASSLAQFSSSVMSDSLWPHGLQHARLPSPSPTPGTPSNSCLSSWWCHPTISSSVGPFSSRLQSCLASGSFPRSQFFTPGGQSIGVSAFSISPSSEYSRLISFRMDWLNLLARAKGLSRVFSNTTVQKHQLFGVPEVIYISPCNLDSSLCFMQLSISHDVLCL